jgi:hypothetical protein
MRRSERWIHRAGDGAYSASRFGRGGERPGVYGAVSKASALLIRVAIVVLFFTVISGSRGWTPVRVGALSVATAAAIAGALCAGVFLRRGHGQTDLH